MKSLPTENKGCFRLIDRLIDWLIGCLVDWFIDWLIGWLVGWLIDWLIDWLINWFGKRHIGGQKVLKTRLNAYVWRGPQKNIMDYHWYNIKDINETYHSDTGCHNPHSNHQSLYRWVHSNSVPIHYPSFQPWGVTHSNDKTCTNYCRN